MCVTELSVCVCYILKLYDLLGDFLLDLSSERRSDSHEQCLLGRPWHDVPPPTFLLWVLEADSQVCSTVVAVLRLRSRRGPAAPHQLQVKGFVGSLHREVT